MSAKIEIYRWTYCPYCNKAIALLESKKVPYLDYILDGDEAARDRMAERTGGPRSVPQIFINDRYIGGCDDLYDLNASGKLDQLIGG